MLAALLAVSACCAGGWGSGEWALALLAPAAGMATDVVCVHLHVGEG